MAKATIDDVAALAGVSMKTVSRVVNREPNVRPLTREKVEAAIRKLDYRPSQSARGLAGRRSYLLGLLYDNPSASYVINAQTGVLAACRPNGYDLLIHPCDYRSPGIIDEVVTLVRQSRVDGLILTPPLSDMRSITDALDRQNIPYVRIAPMAHDRVSPCVYCDDRHGAYEMAAHLIQLGHRRIGFIAGHPDHGASAERESGFRAALEDNGIGLPRRLVVQGYFDFESGAAGGRRLLSLKQRPTAIFCCNDDMACGVIHAAHELDLRIPDELSVTGFDDTPVARYVWPALSTIRQPVQEMAERAARQLLDQLRGQPSADTEEAELKCRLILRQTTAAV